MKPEEQFIKALHLLGPKVLAHDVSAIKNFSESEFEPIQRQPHNDNITMYRKGLVSQIFADIKASLSNQLSTLHQRKPILLKKGTIVKNNNIRFFCKEAELIGGKHAVLFRHIETGQSYFFIIDFDGKNTVQLPFKINPKAKDLIPIEGAYHAHFLLGLVPFMRAYAACYQPETSLLQAIAKGDIRNYATQDNPTPLNAAIRDKLNDSQQRVVANFVNLPQGIQLLMGPPGTGKTTTIIATIRALMENSTIRRPIVICGPSNKSVQVIATSLFNKYPSIKAALYANETCIDPAEKSILAPLLVHQCKNKLRQADVAFMTLSAAGSTFIKTTLKNKVDVAIVDEAGQSVESETLIVFGLAVKKVLLVGDVKQLPPTSLADKAEYFHYDWSMLSRLQDACQQPYGLLNTQYRMHPNISRFPNNAFYSNLMQDGVTAKDKASKSYVPYSIIDIRGEETLDAATRSYQNRCEAICVVELVKIFIERGHQLGDIAIITPYKAQVALIKQLLLDCQIPPDALKINTIDSFQGEESPVVFVSLVRANAYARIGFLKNFQRLNVAITRPQKILRVLMNGDTLNPLAPKGPFQKDFVYLCQQLLQVTMPGKENPHNMYHKIKMDNYYNMEEEFYSYGRREYYSNVSFRRSLDDYVLDKRNKKFEGPSQILRFIRMLNHYEGTYSNAIGKLPILMLPYLPTGTHIIQDILDRIKVWKKLTFRGLPDSTLRPYDYCKFYSTTITVIEEYVDYGYPFDECDNYCPGGYCSSNESSTEEYDHEIITEDLVFDGHLFFQCDLNGVNFHNSYFKNTLFTGSDVRNCIVNFDNMDEISKSSFLQAQQQKEYGDLPKVLPTDNLVLDAIHRGVYWPRPHPMPTSCSFFFEDNQLDQKSLVSQPENTEKKSLSVSNARK